MTLEDRSELTRRLVVLAISDREKRISLTQLRSACSRLSGKDRIFGSQDVLALPIPLEGEVHQVFVNSDESVTIVMSSVDAMGTPQLVAWKLCLHHFLHPLFQSVPTPLSTMRKVIYRDDDSNSHTRVPIPPYWIFTDNVLFDERTQVFVNQLILLSQDTVCPKNCGLLITSVQGSTFYITSLTLEEFETAHVAFQAVWTWRKTEGGIILSRFPFT